MLNVPGEGDHRVLIRRALEIAEARHGLPIRGAQFKAYLTEVEPSFELRTAGFRNLRHFLETFPDVVQVAHDGQDITASTPAAGLSPSAPLGSALETPSFAILRADIWRAFALMDSTLLRFYDPDTKRAVMLPRDRAEQEPEMLKKLRDALDTGRFLPIEPVTSDEQLSEMHAFARQLPLGVARHALETALSQSLWFRAFQTALREHGLEQHWKSRWSEVVLRRVRDWCGKHQVEIPGLLKQVPGLRAARSDAISRREDRSASPSPPDQPHAQPEPVVVRTSELRARILSAIGRMPTSALLALPIPAEYMLD